MRHRFDDIAVNSTGKKKPTEADKDTYLGLEHLDSGSLTVTRFGSEIAPIGEKLLMRKGDVLFGKRRAYQKKVAIAPFDGIFSAHGMVLRPKTDVVTERFFPLFIASDYSLDAAIKISVGSLSPTINWSALRELEFNLPPLNEQDSLAEVLWEMIGTKNAYKQLLSLTDDLVKSQFVEMFGDPMTNPMGWAVEPLGEICENLDSRRIPITMGNRQKGVYPYYGASGIVDYVEDFIFNEDLLLVSEDGANLLARATPIAFSVFGEIWVNNHAHVLRFQEKATQMYIEHRINHIDISTYITGTAQPKLNQAQLNAFPIPLPPLSLQTRFADFVHQADKSKFELNRTLDELDAAYKALVRERLG